MKILVVDPRAELVLHNLAVTDKKSAHHIDDFCKQQVLERGDIDRIIIAGGTCRIMDPKDPIPVPVPAGRAVR